MTLKFILKQCPIPCNFLLHAINLLKVNMLFVLWNGLCSGFSYLTCSSISYISYKLVVASEAWLHSIMLKFYS